MSSDNLEKPSKPSLIQTLLAVIVAAIGWGSGNVISRSLLIDGINEIYLVTIRVVVIGTILFVYYLLFIREKFEITILIRFGKKCLGMDSIVFLPIITIAVSKKFNGEVLLLKNAISEGKNQGSSLFLPIPF